MIELWKDIYGYDGKYQISNKGQVRSLFQKGKTTLLKLTVEKYGYHRIVLRKNGVKKNHPIHRLVADAFIKKVEDKNIVNHINGTKLDNRAENLEWVTVRENNIHYVTKIKKCQYKTGVYRRKTGKYAAHISIENKRVYLGQYETEYEAHQQYINALNAHNAVAAVYKIKVV